MSTTDASMTWRVEIAAWADWLRAAGRSPGTIRLRTHYLHRLADHLATRGLAPWAARTDDVAGWLAAHSWTPETRHSAIASVRGFYSWGVATERTRRSPAGALASSPVHPGRPRPAPEQALAQALEDADPRTRLMLQLAARAGLRRAEIAAVRGMDVEHDGVGPVLRVMGKGHRERLVPISASMARELVERAGGPGWVFPSTDPRQHLTPGHVGRLIAEALPGGWTAHTLRHRFASRAYAGERDIRAVQELLGHTSVVVTQRYTAVPQHAMRRAAEHAA